MQDPGMHSESSDSPKCGKTALYRSKGPEVSAKHNGISEITCFPSNIRQRSRGSKTLRRDSRASVRCYRGPLGNLLSDTFLRNSVLANSTSLEGKRLKIVGHCKNNYRWISLYIRQTAGNVTAIYRDCLVKSDPRLMSPFRGPGRCLE